MTKNIEKTEKAELFHPKKEKKIILQLLRKLGIQYKSGNKVQGPESGMKTQDRTSLKLTIIDFKDEWENDVLLLELCAILNQLGKEGNKEVCTYDPRGH